MHEKPYWIRSFVRQRITTKIKQIWAMSLGKQSETKDQRLLIKWQWNNRVGEGKRFLIRLRRNNDTPKQIEAIANNNS